MKKNPVAFVAKKKLRNIRENIYEVPQEGAMRVPGSIFISDVLLNNVQESAVQQLRNLAQLPGVVKHVLAMPDVHSGYGAPIGGVAAFDVATGMISPGAIGYDINCGVRLLCSNVRAEDFLKKRDSILDSIYDAVPSGVGEKGEVVMNDAELADVLEKGAQWALDKKYATKEDVRRIEDGGCISGADATRVSQRAKARGRAQLGTLGAGNHFLEVQTVETIYDTARAKAFGLKKGNVTIMIHTGSRGLGHQTASDYIHSMERAYGYAHLPDRELACAPINSPLGKDYRAAMAAAANFAFVNRQIIVHHIRNAFLKHIPEARLTTVYDIAHNIAKFEKYTIDGKKVELCVHRKGATRSFGPGRRELPLVYRKTGCPIFLPGSMGTYSYVLAGTKEAERLSFASTAHGAGRVKSRSYAAEHFSAERVHEQLRTHGVKIKSGSVRGLVEESPDAYKDIDEVARVSDALGIGKLVARLKPLAVVKG